MDAVRVSPVDAPRVIPARGRSLLRSGLQFCRSAIGPVILEVRWWRTGNPLYGQPAS